MDDPWLGPGVSGDTSVADAGVTDMESIVRLGIVSFPVGVAVDKGCDSRASSFLMVSSVI